jgi:hypothetical protein
MMDRKFFGTTKISIKGVAFKLAIKNGFVRPFSVQRGTAW